MGVAAIDVLRRDGFELAPLKDQHRVETLAADRADESNRSAKALARGARTGVRMILFRLERKTSSKLDVNFASRPRTRSLTGLPRSRAPWSACWPVGGWKAFPIVDAGLEEDWARLPDQDHRPRAPTEGG